MQSVQSVTCSCCLPQGGARVKRPIAPSRSSQTVLEKHSDDCHHSQAAVGKLCCQLGFAFKKLPAEVAFGCCCASGLILRELAVCTVRDNLTPSCSRNLRDGP